MRISTVITLGVCIALLPLVPLSPAWAAQSLEAVPAPISALTDAQVNERLDALGKRFESQQTEANLWMYGWGAFNGGTMIWSAVEASQTDNRKDRDTSIVQAVESLIGIADVSFRRLPAFDAHSACPQPVVTQEDRLQCLAVKEALAARGAERANERYQLLPHAEILGFNLLAGGIVWALGGFNRALMTALPGELIGEAQLWSMPSQPADDYESYRLQFSPMVRQTNDANDTTVGLKLTWHL